MTSKFWGFLDAPLTVRQVRTELRLILASLRDSQNHHIQAWAKGGGHEANCQVCRHYEEQRYGINRVVRHFGGTGKAKC